LSNIYSLLSVHEYFFLISGKVHLHIGLVEAVSTAISFLYTGVVEITEGTIEDTLKVADYFQIVDLKQCCELYFESGIMTVDNCVKICLLCSFYNLEFYDIAFRFLRGHLPDIMQHESALTLTSESLKTLLTDETLSYVEHAQFFEFIIRWVEFDLENRKQFFPDLFCSLDLEKIPKDVLENQVERYSSVKENESCQKHVLNAKMKYRTEQSKEEIGVKDTILVVGSYRHEVSYKRGLCYADQPCVLGYILAEDRWFKLAYLPQCPAHIHINQECMAFCSKTNCLYMFGDGSPILFFEMHFYKFDLNESEWTTLVLKLPENHIYGKIHTIRVCAGKLYVILSCCEHPTDGQADQDWKTFVMEVKAGTKCNTMQCLFQGNDIANLMACTMQDRDICILANRIVESPDTVENSTHFFVYDTDTNTSYEQSNGAHWDDLMIPVGDEIVVTGIGKLSCTKYSFTTREWRNTEEQVLPFPMEPLENIGYSSVSDGNKLDLIYDVVTTSLDSPSPYLCYDFREKKWKILKSTPRLQQQRSACHVQLLTNFTKCHSDCPHCHHVVRIQHFA
jgi:hypothetical protein